VWCGVAVIYLASRSLVFLPEYLPGYLEVARNLSAPFALAAVAGWLTSSDRWPPMSARVGALRGGVAALVSVLYLFLTIPLTIAGFVWLIASPLAALEEAVYLFMVEVYLCTIPLVWVAIPVTLVVGALYGAAVHRAIGSPARQAPAAPQAAS
jgi:hypothetical protein